MPDLSAQRAVHPVAIHFRDQRISLVFVTLLKSMGKEAVLLNDLEDAMPNTSIITEPLYFNQLTSEQSKKCLIIGDQDSLTGINALSIAQPLTEKKIESALSLFLKKSLSA